MLTKIVLKNYTTFMEETIFDFKATNSKILNDTNVNKDRILKGALFIGENASGKTQALQAIVLLLDFLLDNSEPNFIMKKSMYTNGTRYNLSYEFEIDNNILKYDVEFDGNAFNQEKLYLNQKLVLERLQSKGKNYLTEENTNIDINLQLSIVKFIYFNTRFNNHPILNQWFDFLKNSMYINCLLGGRLTKSYNSLKAAEQIIDKYAENSDATALNKFMKELGYNSEVVFNKQLTNPDQTMKIAADKETICLKKNGTNFAFPLALESTGNRVFMNTLLPILFTTKNNCMLIVDEFSSGLHNELEEALIKYFFNNSKNSQLFFTSHSTNLLDTSLLRPDQIYTFRFDPKRGTIIKRASLENPRESQNIEKMYLNGVFDGMPRYNKEITDK